MFHVERDYWSETEAKNIGLDRSSSPLVAFTNADTLVTENTVARTCDVIGEAEYFVLQGYRWEIPRSVTARILSSELDTTVGSDLDLIENLSIPHAFPHNPTGEWQVAPAELARAVGGFDERMSGPGAKGYGGLDTDFHDRAACLAEKRGGGPIVSRKIPILHLHHYAERPLSANHAQRRTNLEVFAHSGAGEALNWRNHGS